MTEKVIIRKMQPDDLEFAAASTCAEGWQGESIFELSVAYRRDPTGCFIAEISGKNVGMCMGVSYETHAFLGVLIVNPAARGQGIGEKLLMHTVDFLRSRGASSIFLDGVLRAVPLYERCGFQKVCRSLRFGGRLEGRAHAHIQAMTHDDLDEVAQLDLNAFGADRRFFLESRLHLYPYLCKVAKVDGRVAGYIMGRLGHTVLAAGPWVASDRLVRPQDLLESLALEAAMIPITIGCLADNSKSAEILRALRFSEKSDAPWRMVSGRYTQPGMVSMNFAVGSPAKG